MQHIAGAMTLAAACPVTSRPSILTGRLAPSAETLLPLLSRAAALN